jgi:predicted acetyltransferase
MRCIGEKHYYNSRMRRHMNIKLTRASVKYKDVIKNLMQFYMYDFSEYLKTDVEDDGLFAAYNNLEDYWIEKNNRFPYIIQKDERYVGFALVRFIESGERKYFSIAEFFIMKKYRREGIGKSVAAQIFNLHKGQWEVYQKGKQ